MRVEIISPPLILLTGGSAHIGQQGAGADIDPAPTFAAGWFGFGAAMLVIIGAYNGWGDLVVYGEEIEDPGRAIPRALFGGILGVAVLYLAVWRVQHDESGSSAAAMAAGMPDRRDARATIRCMRYFRVSWRLGTTR